MRGSIVDREWMLGKVLMRGLPRPMRDGWQVCLSERVVCLQGGLYSSRHQGSRIHDVLQALENPCTPHNGDEADVRLMLGVPAEQPRLHESCKHS